jgi:hypothetical protein
VRSCSAGVRAGKKVGKEAGEELQAPRELSEQAVSRIPYAWEEDEFRASDWRTFTELSKRTEGAALDLAVELDQAAQRSFGGTNFNPSSYDTGNANPQEPVSKAARFLWRKIARPPLRAVLCAARPVARALHPPRPKRPKVRSAARLHAAPAAAGTVHTCMHACAAQCAQQTPMVCLSSSHATCRSIQSPLGSPQS